MTYWLTGRFDSLVSAMSDAGAFSSPGKLLRAPARRHRLPSLQALASPANFQFSTLCSPICKGSKAKAPLLSLPVRVHVHVPVGQPVEAFQEERLSVHQSVGQNGFEEQLVGGQDEEGGGDVVGLTGGGGGGPCLGERHPHQPSLPVSGDTNMVGAMRAMKVCTLQSVILRITG